MQELVGQRLDDRYRIEELLVRFSALGAVFRAWDERLDRPVAIRTHEVIEGQPIGARYLRQDARLLARLAHPGLQQIFDTGELDGRAWYAAELLEGGTLEDLLGPEHGGRHVPPLAVAAETLGYVHRRGFVHRDLQPRLLRFDAHGRVRLTHFGFAANTGQETPGKTLSTLGAATYMAPELTTGPESAGTPAADVWSMGVMLVAGWIGLERTSVALRELRGVLAERGGEAGAQAQAAWLESLEGELPEAHHLLAQRCLALDPGDRPADGSALAEALGRLSDGSQRGTGPQVFVSHASGDRVRVEREIISPLERAGIPTWYAEADIDSASQWERTILQGLQSSEWFLLVLSPRSAASEWVKDELHWAVRHRPGRILPVLLEPCDPDEFHIRIARIQWVDLTGDMEAAQASLVGRLGAPGDADADAGS